MSIYKDSVFLPTTSFSMRANLPQKEPDILKKWEAQDLYGKIQEKNKKGKTFFLHDGPPYANGHMHVGHALNKILKDAVIKYHNLLGYRAPFTPGWDCHGLPIEWKVETQLREEGISKDSVSPSHLRTLCRAFAKKWVDIQKEELKQLGVLADWDHPYLTMDAVPEAIIAQEILRFLMNGNLYRGLKPVLWSVVEKTALAEAEVEYKDKTSSSIYVMFPFKKAPPSLKDAHVLIWTTTPWTLPANRAIAYNETESYSLITLTQSDEVSLVGKKLLVSQTLLPQLMSLVNGHYNQDATFAGADLKGLICSHPWHSDGYDFEVPLLPAEHVTTDQGTGFVHTAPGHGIEDFAVGIAHDLEIAQPVDEGGTYFPHIPLWGGKHIFKVNEDIITSLRTRNLLFHHSVITHSYPHSWRSKAPLIYRTTAQWFISMDVSRLRDKALNALSHIQWFPKEGKNRMESMLNGRPDWCLSRQRSWGVPLPLFIHTKTGEPLKDPAINDKIIALFAKEGCDVWFEDTIKERILSPHYNPTDFEVCRDIIDVWFESGCTYLFVSGENGPVTLPIDLYLEGSDQHRGWFQSSLLEALGSRDIIPYKAILTHGFLLDQGGYKMSKSQNNNVTPQEIIEKYGTDILRLWVVGSDYTQDLKLGPDILKHQEDIYRRIRNTFRFLLGNLQDKPFEEAIAHDTLPLLEKWVLHHLWMINEEIKACLKTYNLHAIFKILYTFMASDLSSFYFDIRKDVLYCAARKSDEYKATLYVLQKLFDCLVVWLSPVASFTMEEAYQTLYPHKSVHLASWPALEEVFYNPSIDNTMEILREIRKNVLAHLEKARADKLIGSSLEAQVTIKLDPTTISLTKKFPLDELLITSYAEAAPTDSEDLSVEVALAEGEKCERCWKILQSVGKHKAHPTLCERCVNALGQDNLLS